MMQGEADDELSQQSIPPAALTALQVRRVAVLAGAVALVMLAVGGVGFVAKVVEPPVVTRGVPSSGAASVPTTDAQVGYGRSSVVFEANRGQTDPEVRFLSRGPGHSLFLTPEEFVLSLDGGAAKGAPATVLRMRLLEATRQPEVQGLQQLPGTVTYATGSDPAGWMGDVATFAKVMYEGVYPGVDLVFHSERGRTEYDFIVAPGAEPGVVGLAFEGAKGLSLDHTGDLVLETEARLVRQDKPFIYQDLAGGRQEVAGGYDLGSEGRVGFWVGAYDRARPLVIDPQLPYATYLGGEGGDGGTSIAVDASGHAYVTGWTRSPDFPKKNAAQGAYAGSGTFPADECSQPPPLGECGDAFVAKLGPEGSGFVYATYLGGSGPDVGYGIAVDKAGAAYVTGQTKSADFPTKDPFVEPAPLMPGGADAFMTKLDPSGAVAYSTRLGISQLGAGRAVAVDGSGKAYVTGTLFSGFPAKNPQTSYPEKNPLQPATGGYMDAFVTKLDPAVKGEASLVYSTLLGGPGTDAGSGIAVDSAGSAYVTGTAGAAFPTNAPAQAKAGGGTDAFVTKLSPDGSSYVYSTLLGGSGDDLGTAIALDSSGRAHVAGNTTSANFPTKNPFEKRKKGITDGFLAALDQKGSALTYATYLGGADTDAGGLAVDPSGKAHVAGVTRADLPVKDSFQPGRKGPSDGFVVKLDPKKSGAGSLLYSTYLGGGEEDSVRGIAVDPRGAAYVTGSTGSRQGFPFVGALKSTLGGRTDGFVAKLVDPPAGSPTVTGVAPNSGAASGGTLVTITGTGFEDATAVRFGRVEAPGHAVEADGTRMTVRAPRHADGVVMVSVVTKKGSSGPGPAASFTYSDGGWVRIPGPARMHHTATVLADGRVLVAGGCAKAAQKGACAEPTDTAELYDPLTGKWAPTAKMGTAGPTSAPSSADHTATLLTDGKVLVMRVSSAELYDPAKGAWNPTAAPPSPLQHTATLLPDGKVLRIGLNGQTDLYDPTTVTWAPVGTRRPVGRAFTATLLANGKVLAVGDRAAGVFDPVTATWTSTPGPEILRAGYTATLLPDGKVLLAGGVDSAGEVTATSEVYDPEAVPDPAKPDVKGAWSAARDLTFARYAHTATPLPSGKVLVAGGSYDEGLRLTSAELFDPATGRWIPAGEMSMSRGASIPTGSEPSFSATLLNDGSTLVVGGADAVTKDGVTPALGSAERYGAGLEQTLDPPGAPAPDRKPSEPAPWLPSGGAVVLAAVAVLVIRRRHKPNR
ncbi:MAG: SBBP repeat-containing protein [Acidimicrobiales bacterium]